jgi:hypothetical protein
MNTFLSTSDVIVDGLNFKHHKKSKELVEYFKGKGELHLQGYSI